MHPCVLPEPHHNQLAALLENAIRHKLMFRESTGLLCQLIQGYIEVQHIDARLSEQAELPAGDVLLDKLPDAVLIKVTGSCDAGRLEERGVRSDVRVEAGAGGGDQVDGHRRAGILGREFAD